MSMPVAVSGHEVNIRNQNFAAESERVTRAVHFTRAASFLGLIPLFLLVG